MRSVPRQIVLAAVLVLSITQPLRAQGPDATPLEQQFAALEARYASPPSDVQQTAYFGPPALQPEPVAPPPSPVSTSGLTIIQPANGASPYPSPGDSTEIVTPPDSDAWCLPPQPPCRTSSWSAAVEFIITQSYVTHADFGSWPDDDTLGIRLILGYEDPRGLGTRVRLWGLGQDVSAFSEDVELEAGAFDFDLYKRLFIDDTELVLGGGASSRSLEFRQPGNGYSRFRGGGLSLFAEGFVPLIEFPNAELGQVGRARVALTTGNWNDTTDQMANGAPGPENIVPGTDHDSMTVTEFAWGLEFRRRFGRAEDHSWYIAALVEHQRWQSDWMGAFMGSSVSFTGLNLSTGLSW